MPHKTEHDLSCSLPKDWGHGKRTQPQSSKGKVDLRTIINSKKAAGKRSWRPRAQAIEDFPPRSRAVNTSFYGAPSPFDVLRGPVCQPCHLVCFMAQAVSGYAFGGKAYQYRVLLFLTVSEPVRSYGSSIQRDTFWTAVHETSTVVWNGGTTLRWWSWYGGDFGQAQVDLFVSRETSHCPLWFSLTHSAPLGLDAMVQTWPRLRLYAFFPQSLCSWESWREFAGIGFYYYFSLPHGGQQSMVLRFNIPSWRASSGAPRQEGSSVPSRGLDISPPTRTVETVGLASEGPSSWTQVSQPRLLRPFFTSELPPWGKCMPWSGKFSLHVVVTVSWTS